MAGTSNAYNQGIMHLSGTRGGRPWCGTRRAIMATTTERAADEPRICIKCQRVRDDMKARAAAKVTPECTEGR